MATAKAISMSVRPIQSADLCFPVSGIIEYQPENLLGLSVQAFDLSGLQQKMEPEAELPSTSAFLRVDNLFPTGDPVVPNPIAAGIGLEGPSCDGPSMIKYKLKDGTLSRLRAEDIATQLTQAIAWYILKDSADQADEAIEKRIELLGRNTADSNSVLALLGKLSDSLRKRHDKLANLYNENGVDAVTNTWTESSGTSSTSGEQTFNTTSSNTTSQFGREYEVPPADNRARWLRSEISLRQERLAAYRLVKLNSPRNVLFEKTMTTSQIRKIQLEYIDTFLVAPFDGMVTTVFRNVGDFVTVGQPVLRLENDKTVYLVGTIKCRSLIRVGYKATVSTILFGEPSAVPVEVSGTVCAVRGHEPVDEQWNVIIRCSNRDASGAILPLNYNFDFDNTEIEIEEV